MIMTTRTLGLVSINQPIKMYMYIASLPDPYSEALLTQAKRKITASRRKIENRHRFGRCLRSIGSSFHVAEPTTEKERANGTTKFPWTAVYDGLHKKRGRQSSKR